MYNIVEFLLGGWLPEWLIYLIAYIIVTTIILIVAPLTMMMQVWFERRMVARMQDRLGPNRVGPAGLLQSIADGVKMFTKEDIVPRAADKWVHLLAPIIAVAPVMFMLAVVPWGRGVVPAEVNVSVLFVLAVSSVSAVGLMMAGWGSNNKFALLGAMRAVAQMVSYEIPAVLGLLGIVLLTGTMSLSSLSEFQAGVPILGTTVTTACSIDPGTSHAVCPAGSVSYENYPALRLPQQPQPNQASAEEARKTTGFYDLGLGWFVFTPIGLVGFLLFFISALSEGERTPFDIPEADSEIVAGYMTEYSGMKFAIFYLGQFVLNYALSMIASIAFLGGWQGPGVGLLVQTGDGFLIFLAGVLSVLYLFIKSWFLFFVMVWLRGAFPRLRVDQLMGFAWKFLLPLALVNILSIGLWVAFMQWGSDPKWTAHLVILSVDLLGWLTWLETAPAWEHQLFAWFITAIINGATYYWLLMVNRRPEGETPAGLAEDQVFGTIGLPQG
jgi:NADH-quinone oxidoreductase subunit H